MVTTMAKPDDWITIEHVRDVLDDIRQRLSVGSTGGGATLSADECVNVLACLKDPAWPSNRPPDPGKEFRQTAIRIHLIKLERAGKSPASAIAETARAFKVSKGIVRKVRRDALQK